MATPEMKDGVPHGSDHRYEPPKAPFSQGGATTPSTAQHGDSDLEHIMSEARSRARSTGRWSEAEIQQMFPGGGSTPAPYEELSAEKKEATKHASTASAAGTGKAAGSTAAPSTTQHDASNPLGTRSAEKTMHRTIAGATDDEMAPSDAAGTVAPEKSASQSRLSASSKTRSARARRKRAESASRDIRPPAPLQGGVTCVSRL